MIPIRKKSSIHHPHSNGRVHGKENGLWKIFTETAELDAPKSSPLATNKDPSERWEDVFLSHARVYTLADYYDIQPLANLSSKKLHQALVAFQPHKERIQDLNVLIQDSFENTIDKQRNQDRLRHILCLFAACKVKELWPNPEFQELLCDLREFSSSIIGHLLQIIN
jgi:hypothetical protein